MKTTVPALYILFAALSPLFSAAQDTIAINEVRVTSYLVKQSLLRTPAAAAVIDSAQLQLQTSGSLVPAFNTIPGVRMEERSPGSYRLSLRGSLLRSPFGVRNVKIYLDEYPLTDAGGNTYINSIAMNAVYNIDVLKGPDGSLFGANSGGVVNIHTGNTKDRLTTELAGGSYGLFKQNIAFTKNSNAHVLNIVESYQQADGYRQNSRMKRMYVQVGDQWRYNKHNSIKALVLYSNLYYRTPGGLTLAQYEADPAQARPPTATVPGASEQKAAIYNKMLFGGITHTAQLNSSIENVIAVFASTVDFKNPFITNYEMRKEDTYGARTFLIFSNNKTNNAIKWEYDIGAEWQQTQSNISNYTNDHGNKGTLMVSGTITSDQHFIFHRLKIDLHKKLLLEAGLSVNFYKYRFKDSAQLSNRFKTQWMPRLAISYAVTNKFSLRSSVSRGYSPPTTAEIRPSDNNIYPNLQAETGINIELGARYFALHNTFFADAAVYHYRLHNAIVRQQNSLGAEYFVNAGGTDQTGVELQLSYQLISPAQHNRLINKLQLNNSTTFNNFFFDNYASGANDYSGNTITGVPKQTVISSVLLQLQCSTYLFIQHNYTAAIPLNDGNTVFAKAYNLVQLKLGHSFSLKNPGRIELYAGIDNLLNQRYSLGNDLNAVGNRFYNAAPLRNYFAGIIFSR